ncbi:MAG: hypothetical protein NC038_04405 [Paludibacter sp.]|nr:hypothetical protein [Bacteroidales bacterium]MCM1069464.1 hypothetical protein [Prevotella sp.]MCM1353838.1 hypothetical protein [Bacteroides sp.]MCM1442762.1 hypothetical protein [Muribaculum sp.]MCM1481874.1 hypothetical protein [Paludibacter sp.]
MKNIVQKSLLALAIGFMLTIPTVSAETFTYDFNGVNDLSLWDIKVSDPSYVQYSLSSNYQGLSSSTPFFAMSFVNKSKQSLTMTTVEEYTGISNITFDAVSTDNSKPNFTLKIIKEDNTEVTLISEGTTKSTFGSSGTKKWATGYSVNVPSPCNGKVQFYMYASSSGKHAGLDNIKITHAGNVVKSSDASLSDLRIDGVTISGFTPNVTTYSYAIPASQNTVPKVEATTNDNKATCSITQPTGMNGSATVKVTAEDGTTQIYTINFTQTTAPLISGFTVAGVSATINQSAKTIMATLPYGTSLTNLTPTVALTNADSYTPTGAQNFSSTITYTAIKGSNTTAYSVTLTVAPPKSSDATLSSISVGGSLLPGFSPTTYDYAYDLPAGTTTVPATTATVHDSKATCTVSNATSLPGNTIITVTAEDGTTQTYSIRFKVALPQSHLRCHEPERYESDIRGGGYGTPLVQYQGREYEVYYTTRVDKKPAVGTTNAVTYNLVSDATETSFSSTDGWIEGTVSSLEGGTSGSSKASATAEFAEMYGDFKIYNDTKVTLRIKGYDQFRIVAKDNNATESKGKHFEVSIDGIKQSMSLATSATLRSFDMTTDEHIIEVRGIGGSNNYLYGFSLRVSDAPRVKYVAGDDKTQIVNQTRPLSPITYAIRNYVSARLEWDGSSATGISLLPMNTVGDTLQLTGTANCAVGTYTYRVVALDKNGSVASECTGSFKVQTEVRATNGTEHTVWINDLMTPITFDYDALRDDDITFSWSNTPAGLSVTQDKEKNQYSIVGTPTEAGTYTYTLTAAGGNTLTGTIVVDVPSPMLIAPADSITKVKATQILVPIVWTVKFAKNATVSGLPNGIQGTYNNGTVTLSGTPAAETSYPKIYTYTITAEPLYAGKEPVSAKGEIVVIDPNAKSLLYLYKDDYADGMYAYLSKKYDVSARPTDESMRPAVQYENYDVIVLSENIDANNGEALSIVRTLQKPVLNLKGFMYTASRLNWGYADNGSISATEIIVTQPSHPVFQGMSAKEGMLLQLIDEVVDNKGLMPVETTLSGSLCLATAPKRGDDYYSDGKESTFLHEVPASVRGEKYMLLPLSQSSSKGLTESGKRLTDNIISYLLSSDTEFGVPELRISSFSINGVSATIDESKQTIRLVLPEDTDLSALTPEVAVVGMGTFVSPNSGETVDFSDQHYGVTYVVSDYINKRTYQAIVSVETALDAVMLEGVWFDGQTLHNSNGLWLHIFDTTGRLITSTNNDCDLGYLPNGVYLVQGIDGNIKIVK